jgi:4-hydroxybenzoate polyprenyltransferase
LFVVNATLSFKLYPVREAVGLAVVSLVCLIALYLFNDVVDARDDQQNPKKDRRLADLYLRNRRTFFTAWFVLTAVTVAAAATLELHAAAFVLAVSAINVAYSLYCKRVPLVDIACVAIWGAAYASIVTEIPAWIVMTAAMTAVCHMYQIDEDRAADACNGFATSATLPMPVLVLLTTLLAGVLVAASSVLAAPLVAVTFFGFVAYWIAWRDRSRTAWLIAKTHFSIVWAYLLLYA